MANHLNNVERGRVFNSKSAALKIYNKVDAAMHGFTQNLDRFSYGVAKSFMPPEYAQQQLVPNFAKLNTQIARLTPKEIEQVAFLVDTNGASLNTNGGSKKSRKRRPSNRRRHEGPMPPNVMRTFMLIVLMLALLAACSSSEGSTDEQTDTVAAETTDEVTTQPTPRAIRAPLAVTPIVGSEDAEAELPLTEKDDAETTTEEEEETTTPPDEEATESAYLVYVEVIKAAQEAGEISIAIVVTPETFIEVDLDTEEPVYIVFDESNEDDPAYIVVTRDADGETSFKRVLGKRYNPNPEAGTIDFFENDEDEEPNAEPTATFDAITLELTGTPEALPVPTPVDPDGEEDDDGTPIPEDETPEDGEEDVDGSKSIELATEQIGLEVEKISTESITLHEAVGGDDNVEPTKTKSTSEYILAYDQYGSVIGSWDGEAWIPGGQFTAEEIDPDGNVSFTNTTGNSEGGTGTKAIVESRIDIPEGLELLDANGNPTGIFAETLLLASWIGTEGVETGYVVYMEHARNSAGDSGQGVIGSTFQESPLPLWTYTDYEINYAKRFAAGYPLVFVYAGLVPDQSVNWYELSEGELPLLDSGNRVYLNFAANGMNGRGTEAGPMANFLRPITSTYDSLFYTTGNPADAGAGVQRFNGKPLLVVPNGGTTINHTFIPVSSSTSN